MGKEYWKSACPHDCPSACALEVERLSSTRIGRIRGAAANSYTDGVVCGGNPVSTQVNAMTHIAKARRARGAKLAVIDVYRTPTIEAADIALVLRPGTDGALALAVMHVLLRERLIDRDYLTRHTDFD